MQEVFKKYGISDSTQDFLGHAVALYTDDEYLPKNCKPAMEKMQIYTESIGRYGDSPFLYPIYGLGGLP
jgi:Rab GDP dissociation inhibitor